MIGNWKEYNESPEVVAEAFEQLYKSVKAFNKRFGISRENQTEEFRLVIELEELGEVARATNELEPKLIIAVELADLIYVIVQHALLFELPLGPAMQRVVLKNAAKTIETHEVVGGKVVKIKTHMEEE